MKNLKKNILLGLATTATVVAPVVAVVSCGKNNGPAEVEFNFDSKAHSVMSAKHLWDDFYKDKAVENADKGVNVTLSASKGASLTVKLTTDEWNKVVTAGDVVQDVDDNTSLADFADVMNQVTGTTHQYYFDKAIAKKLGADGDALLLGKLRSEYDEVFSKQWLMDNLIHKMPNGISIKNLDWHQSTNNVVVTFTDGPTDEKVDFHLADAKNADEAKSKNEGGANPFVKFLDHIAKPIKSIFGSIKEFFILAKPKVNKDDFKDLAEGILADAATGLVAGAAEMIPPAKVILSLPIVGDKVEGFVGDHLVKPITDKIVDALV